FDKPPENRTRIDICFPNVLSNDQIDDLERMVTKEEVKKAVWDCGSDKSPGPDGFSFSFFRHFWSTIENDIHMSIFKVPYDPVKVKYEFLDHFRNRFDKPPENRARIDICFPNVLSNDQRDDLERMVTKEEVKKGVWDCGSDKSPGLDSF
nr:RNA-directed DNA polymerase, eukaryota [Tanacetum cinerariifolium]